VSAYARPGYQCRHNRNYWQFGDYLGLGAGAHGKLTDVGAKEIYRTERAKQPREYLSRESSQERIVTLAAIPSRELPFEFMLNALRLNEGFTQSLYESRSGLDLVSLEPTLALALESGLMEKVGGFEWRVTPRGGRFLNDVQMLFLAERKASPTTPTEP